jgi:hypothetical protein
VIDSAARREFRRGIIGSSFLLEFRRNFVSGSSRFSSRFSFRALTFRQRRKGESMKNPLDSLWGTIISGLVLTVILYFVVQSLIR